MGLIIELAIDMQKNNSITNLQVQLINLADHHNSLDNYFTGSELNHVKNVKYIKGDTSDIEKLIQFKIEIVFLLQ